MNVCYYLMFVTSYNVIVKNHWFIINSQIHYPVMMNDLTSRTRLIRLAKDPHTLSKVCLENVFRRPLDIFKEFLGSLCCMEKFHSSSIITRYAYFKIVFSKYFSTAFYNNFSKNYKSLIKVNTDNSVQILMFFLITILIFTICLQAS